VEARTLPPLSTRPTAEVVEKRSIVEGNDFHRQLCFGTILVKTRQCNAPHYESYKIRF
jgi:hypothetical protein